MAFIRRKNVNGYQYYQVVHNYRDGGKHRQKVVCHLGKYDSVEAAIDGAKQKIAFHRQANTVKRRKANRIRKQLLDRYGSEAEYYLFLTFDEVYDELAWMRWRNPFRSSTYSAGPYDDADSEAYWYHEKEEWDIRKELLELCVSHNDALVAAYRNQERVSDYQEKLDKLLICQQKYFGHHRES